MKFWVVTLLHESDDMLWLQYQKSKNMEDCQYFCWIDRSTVREFKLNRPNSPYTCVTGPCLSLGPIGVSDFTICVLFVKVLEEDGFQSFWMVVWFGHPSNYGTKFWYWRSLWAVNISHSFHYIELIYGKPFKKTSSSRTQRYIIFENGKYTIMCLIYHCSISRSIGHAL